MSEPQYYILSLKNSGPNHAVWWKPNAAGYTHDLREAGKYSQSQVEDNAGYFANGFTTKAVRSDVAESIARLLVDWQKAQALDDFEMVEAAEEGIQ